MLGDVIAHQHALRAVRFLMVQRYRIAVRQCHINSSVQIDNTAYLAAFLIDRLVKFSALCGMPATEETCPPEESPIRNICDGFSLYSSACARRKRTAFFASMICAGKCAMPL